MARRDIHSDLVADVIWWVRGYRAAMEQSGGVCPFGGRHEDALAELRMEYKERTDKERDKT